MSTKAKTESSVVPELETDVKEEQGSPDSSKLSQKKKKPPTTRRRTKTGCLSKLSVPSDNHIHIITISNNS